MTALLSFLYAFYLFTLRDNRYTKIGYAGNTEPQKIMPTAIAIKETASVGAQAIRRLSKGLEDLDFFIGDEALVAPFVAPSYSVKVGRQEGSLLFVGVSEGLHAPKKKISLRQ